MAFASIPLSWFINQISVFITLVVKLISKTFNIIINEDRYISVYVVLFFILLVL